jgi:uncharacterized protein (TIGR00255 family)
MKSMTGFGRGEVAAAGWRYSVEISSVNRKQSDIVINLARDWQELEAPLRQLVAECVSRGRVNVAVNVERARGSAARARFDADLARQYIDAFARLEKVLKRPVEIEATDLLRAPGVFVLEDIEPAAPQVWPQLQKAVRKALTAFNKARSAEGAAMKDDLKGRLAALRKIHSRIAKQAPPVVARYRETLHRRLSESGLPLPLDDDRLLKEIALFAERCDVSEEVARFASHLDQFDEAIERREPAGRAMDFLCQELHRELNTIGAKANDAGIAHLVVAGKSEVEKLREQVQNVE